LIVYCQICGDKGAPKHNHVICTPCAERIIGTVIDEVLREYPELVSRLDAETVAAEELEARKDELRDRYPDIYDDERFYGREGV
jgi:recombinational DNA repair protein (RecF pathway)